MSGGYIKIKVDGIQYPAHRLAWLYMTGEWPRHDIDHRDMNRVNNRFANLRDATRSQNKANQRAYVGSATGLKGTYRIAEGRFRSIITIDGKRQHLGYFAIAEEANAAYLIAARQGFGEFARSA